MACGAAIALTGCSAQEAEVVKGAFEKDIKSANVTLDVSARAKEGSMKLSLSGPYQSNGKNQLPNADMALKVEGAFPRPIEGRIISTGKNAFVEYGGQIYEVGEAQIAQLQKQGASGAPTQLSPSDIQAVMRTMDDWFPQSDAQDNADLEGEPVTRVTGKLDLSAALKDLKTLAKKPGMSGVEALKQLSNGDIKEIERAVSDPRFTIDIAKSDGKLRRVVTRMKINDGGEKAVIDFALRFKDVDKPVTIDAPSSGKPIEGLLQKLEEDFGGGGGGGGSATENADETIS